MKKTLIALAVLSAISGAQAQVTLYGIADVWLGQTSVTSDEGVKINNSLMASGGLTGSRIGVMGQKDMGNGLTSLFKLEQGLHLNTSETGDTESSDNRQAYVGFAGGMGQLTFGTTWTAMEDVLGAANSGFDASFSASNNVLVLPSQYASNPGNTIKYTSPSWSGLTAALSHSMDGGKADKADISDFSLSYIAGPVATNVAYQVQSATAAEDIQLTAFNASYDFGVFKLLGSVGLFKEGAKQSQDVQYGIDVPLTPALTVSVGYARSDDNSANTNEERTGFGLAAAYDVHASTTVYGGVRQAKAKHGQAKDSLMAVGIKHAF
jgi:predicted porin